MHPRCSVCVALHRRVYGENYHSSSLAPNTQLQQSANQLSDQRAAAMGAWSDETWCTLLGGVALSFAASLLWQLLLQAWKQLLMLWLLTEMLFFLLVWVPRFRQLDKPPEQHWPPGGIAAGLARFERCMRCMARPGFDHQAYLCGVMRGKPEYGSIKRGNVEDFIAYCWFYRTRRQMEAMGEARVLSRCANMMEDAWGCTFPPGHNERVRHKSHLTEPLKASFLPLVFYIITNAVGMTTRHLLNRWGFKNRRHNGMPYHTLHIKKCSTPLAAPAPAPAVQYKVCASVRVRDGPAADIISAMASSPCSSEDSWTPFGNGASTTSSSRSSGNTGDAQRQAATAGNEADDVLADLPDQQRLLNRCKTGLANLANSMRDPALLSQRTVELMHNGASPLHTMLTENLDVNMPILFIHGVTGLPGYLEMLVYLMALGNPLIAVEIEGISLRFGQSKPPEQIAADVIGILDKLGMQRACVVGHSFGTIITGQLARHYPSRVHQVCLIDAVCFGMYMPHLVTNFFMYDMRPQWTSWAPRNVLDWLGQSLRRALFREVNLAASVSRRFFWSELCLFPEDLPRGSIVILSGKDDLMDSDQVKGLLQEAGHVKVLYNEGLGHGDFLFDKEVKRAIRQEVKGLLTHSGHAVAGLAAPMLGKTVSRLGDVLSNLGAGTQQRLRRSGAMNQSRAQQAATASRLRSISLGRDELGWW